MSHLNSFCMFVGSTGAWRQGTTDRDVLLRFKAKMRQTIVKAFPPKVSDTWLPPESRAAFPGDAWKRTPEFLSNADKNFVTAIEGLSSQDLPTQAPLELVNANLAAANELNGSSFTARTSAAGEESINGCYYIDHVWKHTDSYTILKDGAPWTLELTDDASGQSVSIPVIAGVMYECVLEDCD